MKSFYFGLIFLAVLVSCQETTDFETDLHDVTQFSSKFSPSNKTRTLVLIDNYIYLTTHSQFFRDLGATQKVTIKFASEGAISNGSIKLSSDKKYLYDTVVLMCTSLQDMPETKDFNLRKFFDAGNNIMFLADFDTSLWFRNLAKDFGFALSGSDQYLKDYTAAFNTQDPTVFYVTPKDSNILFPEQIDAKNTRTSLGIIHL